MLMLVLACVVLPGVWLRPPALQVDHVPVATTAGGTPPPAPATADPAKPADTIGGRTMR